MSFMTWSSKTWEQVKMIVKTWQPQVWNLTFFPQDLVSQILNCYIFATPCPQVLTMIALFKTWLSNSWRLLSQIISTLDPSKNFHDMVFQDMNTSEHDCQDLAATGLKSYTVFHDLACQVLNCFTFELHVPKSWQWLFKTWLSKSWNVWVTPWTILWWACSCLRCS